MPHLKESLVARENSASTPASWQTSNGKVTNDELHDKVILCIDCHEEFVWTVGEQTFFRDKGLQNEPKRCKGCKQKKTERLNAIIAAQESGVRQRIEVAVHCAQCDEPTTVPFYPSQGRPVYCRSCFLAQRNSSGDNKQIH